MFDINFVYYFGEVEFFGDNFDGVYQVGLVGVDFIGCRSDVVGVWCVDVWDDCIYFFVWVFFL